MIRINIIDSLLANKFKFWLRYHSSATLTCRRKRKLTNIYLKRMEIKIKQFLRYSINIVLSMDKTIQILYILHTNKIIAVRRCSTCSTCSTCEYMLLKVYLHVWNIKCIYLTKYIMNKIYWLCTLNITLLSMW